jgi:hypothetical protein
MDRETPADSILTGLNVMLFIIILITRDKLLGWEQPPFTFAPSHARERGHRVAQKGIIARKSGFGRLAVLWPLESVWNVIQTCEGVVVLWFATPHSLGRKD